MEVVQENIKGIAINRTDNEMSWRLIHDGNKVVDLFESSGITSTVHTILLAQSLEECQTQIYSLDLDYTP